MSWRTDPAAREHRFSQKGLRTGFALHHHAASLTAPHQPSIRHQQPALMLPLAVAARLHANHHRSLQFLDINMHSSPSFLHGTRCRVYRRVRPFSGTVSASEQDRVNLSRKGFERAPPKPHAAHANTLEDSSFLKMRELRTQHEGRPYRAPYAFDPRKAG
jgi:hypothetical protein